MSFQSTNRFSWGRTPLLDLLKPGINPHFFKSSNSFIPLYSNDDDDSDHDNEDDHDDMEKFDRDLEQAIKSLENYQKSGIADGLAEALLAAFGESSIEQVVELLEMILSSSKEFVQQRHGNKHDGGRDFAMAFLEPFEEGTLGKLLYHSIKPFWEYFGDTFSDKIGLHYKRHLGSILKLKPTAENIKLIAIVETHWWQSRGSSGSVGKFMGAPSRERRLRARLEKLALQNPEKWTSLEKSGEK